MVGQMIFRRPFARWEASFSLSKVSNHSITLKPTYLLSRCHVYKHRAHRCFIWRSSARKPLY